jgi:hypothetical protein
MSFWISSCNALTELHDRESHMKFRMRYRPLHIGIALGIVTLVWLAGPYLFPQSYMLVLSLAFLLIFVAWLVDAVIQSVRRRMAAGKR